MNKLNFIYSNNTININENGYKNILEFFASHICNKICCEINLLHPRKKRSQKIINEKFFSNKYLTEIQLCKNCSVPIKLNVINTNFICGSCLQKENSSKYNIYCTKCNSPFTFSSYEYNCKLENYPEKCLKCRNNF